MTVLDPIPSTLFCGMGTHARSTFIYMNHYAIQKIYIVRPRHDTTEFKAMIPTIQDRITREAEKLDHVVRIMHVKINERKFLDSYKAIVRLYHQERNTHVITDLTAGHKIISYLLFYAHVFAKPTFTQSSRLVYLWRNDDTPIELPEININRPSRKIETFLSDVHQYHKTAPNMSLTQYLTNGHGSSGTQYPKSTISRYKKVLIARGLITRGFEMTMLGRMHVASLMEVE